MHEAKPEGEPADVADQAEDDPLVGPQDGGNLPRREEDVGENSLRPFHRAVVVAYFSKLKGSIGEGSNHSKFSHQSSVKIMSKFSTFC